jgi:hypothetical protein
VAAGGDDWRAIRLTSSTMPLLQSRFWRRFRKAAPCRLFALSRFVSPLTLQLSSVDRCVALAAAAATTWFAFDAGIDCGVGKRARECKSYGAVRTHDREVNGVSHHAMPHRAIRRGGQLIGPGVSRPAGRLLRPQVWLPPSAWRL